MAGLPTHLGGTRAGPSGRASGCAGGRTYARGPARYRSAAPNLPDMALRVHTFSSLHGFTRNPWHPAAPRAASSGAKLRTGQRHEPDRAWKRYRRLAAQSGNSCGIASIRRLPAAYPMRVMCRPKTDCWLSS